MFEHSTKRLASLGALALMTAAGSASAQNNEWKYDKLNDMLQRRMQQPGTEAAPPPAPGDVRNGPGTRGIQTIQPQEREQKYHQLKKEDTTAPAAAPRGVIRGDAAGIGSARLRNSQSGSASGGGAALSRPTIDAAPNVGSPPRTRSLRLGAPPAPPASAPAAGEVKVAGDIKEVPVAKPNSYVIQLRPETTSRQLDALLAKYKLRIVSDELIKIGSIVVEQTAADTAETNRARSYSKIEDILEPKIIRDLRREPAVKEAIVNTVVAPKWLPKPVSTQLPVGGKMFKWRWGKADATDGNWGLKYLRIPTVWAILKSYRAKHPDKSPPMVGVIDSGFGENADLAFTPALDTPLARALPGASACAVGHGTHVAGIVGAKFDNSAGIDGVAPNVGIEAVGVKADFVLERPLPQPGMSPVDNEENSVDTVLMLYTDVLKTATKYVVPNLNDASRLRVINLSLAYNWYNILGKKNPAENKTLQRHIASEAALFKTLAELAQDKILFVVAAGNDSRGWETPLEAKWASSIAWAGTHETPQSKPSPNILVAEAFDRDGKRADFSNRGGHVSAPGVDIMSTAIAGAGQDVALCSGTSQAAPHVAAVAALMFEMAPDKKPKDIADILKKTAQPSGQKFAAPLVDPLDAVLAASPETLTLLADLNGDGKIGKEDLVAFKDNLASLQMVAARFANPAGSLIASAGPTPGDYNGDGLPDAGQVWWPRADLNGSGLATVASGDERSLCNGVMTDLDIIKLAWQDQAETFDAAMTELDMINPAPIAASAPAGQARPAAAQARGGTRSLTQVPRNPCAPQ